MPAPMTEVTELDTVDPVESWTTDSWFDAPNLILTNSLEQSLATEKGAIGLSTDFCTGRQIL
jgi:hypothetical protein